MRGKETLEAYLDDYTTIHFYFSMFSYQGESSKFYLKDDQDLCEELSIMQVETHNNYKIYTLNTKRLTIGKQYYVEHEYGRKTPLQYGLIVKSEEFNQTYQYDGNDLGATFNNNSTTFKVFAPTASKMELLIKNQSFTMLKSYNGLYSITIPEYLHNVAYKYRVYCNGSIKETIDPYCIKTTFNNSYSIAYDTSTLNQDQFVRLNSYTDAIIYETNIADFTAQFKENPSTFVAFQSAQCLEYLSDLGISHVQLLPITSCGSTDDYHPTLHYNWGYDVTHFQAITNRYGVEDSVLEFKNLVELYHKHQIGINLDMVFNHVHDLDTSPLQILVPYYYFQINQAGNYSNATYCGNDFDSTRYMASKLVVDSCVSWMKTYQVDGFRFDLMGILDIATLNKVYEACSKINSSVMLYGEGWNMESLLASDQRATIQNQAFLPNVAHFNDYFRDILKGKKHEKGYLTYNQFFGDLAKIAFLCTNYMNPNNSINYIECHDNMTLFDHVQEVCFETNEIKNKRMELMLGSIIFSYGIPFIHSGLEYARSKQGLDNTYRDKSSVNHFDWSNTNHPLITQLKQFIKIRKKYASLRYALKKEVNENVCIDYIYEDVLMITTPELVVIYNTTHYSIDYDIKGHDLLHNQIIEKLAISPYSVNVVAL